MENIGWASLEIVPSLRGFEGKVNAGTSGALTRSGTSGGEKFGTGFAHKASHTMREKFKESAKFIIGPLVGAFALEKGVEFAKEAISGAEDLAKSQNRLNLIFGKSAEEVDKFGERSANTYGLSDIAARKAASSIGILGRQAGLSNEENAKFSIHFSKMASDLASFNNVDPSQTLNALTKGLAGATRGLKPYGILIDSAQQKAEALNLGLLKPVKDQAKIHAAQIAVLNDTKAYNDEVAKSGKGSLDSLTAQAKLGTAQKTLQTAVEGTLPPLTAQQKVLANASLIQKQASVAQGDFKKSSGDLANQQKILSANISNVEDRIGKGLLPIAGDFVHFINDKGVPALDRFSHWFEKDGSKGIQRFITDAKPLAHSLLPALGTGFSDIAGFLKTAAPYAKKTIDAFNSLPDWAQKTIVLGASAGFVAKKTGLLSFGKSALSGGGIGEIATMAKPLPVLVVNEGFSTGPGGKGGPSVLTTGAKVKTGLEAGSRAEKVAAAAADAAAEAKAAGAGIFAQSAAAARAGKAAAAAFDEAALKEALSFGGKGLLRGLLAAPLPALGSQVNPQGVKPITALGGLDISKISGLAALHKDALGRPDVLSWEKLDNVLSRMEGHGKAGKVAEILAKIAHTGDILAGDHSGFSQLDSILPDTTTKLERFTKGAQGSDRVLKNFGLGQNSTLDLVTTGTHRFGRSLASLPQSIETKLTTPGLDLTRRDVLDLTRDIKLTPRAIHTAVQLTGLDAARKQIDQLRAHAGRHIPIPLSIELAGPGSPSLDGVRRP